MMPDGVRGHWGDLPLAVDEVGDGSRRGCGLIVAAGGGLLWLPRAIRVWTLMRSAICPWPMKTAEHFLASSLAHRSLGETLTLFSLCHSNARSHITNRPTAKSLLKMADAYLDKSKYSLAAKQFLKVIKKAPDHLPAHLGYATAVERAGKSKQIGTAALAYANATRVAILQGERVDPTVDAGRGGIAENILRRAVQLAKSAPVQGSGGGNSRLETLRKLGEYAHTLALAAEIHYEIGMEIVANSVSGDHNGGDSKKEEAVGTFSIANGFIAARNDTKTPYHIGSIVELGKIALDEEGNGRTVVRLFQKVKDVHMEDDRHAEMLVLVGQAHVVSICHPHACALLLRMTYTICTAGHFVACKIRERIG